MLASLELPSVVRALGAFEDRGTAYLVMEFIDGVPLHEKAAELGGRIPPELLLPRLGPLLRDLERMHESGLIHRDITPDNIMWTRDGALKLIDFGSARTTSSKRFTVMYKRGFAPVEQYLDSDQGPLHRRVRPVRDDILSADRRLPARGRRAPGGGRGAAAEQPRRRAHARGGRGDTARHGRAAQAAHKEHGRARARARIRKGHAGK